MPQSKAFLRALRKKYGLGEFKFKRRRGRPKKGAAKFRSVASRVVRRITRSRARSLRGFIRSKVQSGSASRALNIPEQTLLFPFNKGTQKGIYTGGRVSTNRILPGGQRQPMVSINQVIADLRERHG